MFNKMTMSWFFVSVVVLLRLFAVSNIAVASVDGLETRGHYLDGAGDENVNDVAVDKYGCVYVVGDTDSWNIQSPAPSYNHTYVGGTDAFIAKYSAAGQLVAFTYIGGGSYDSARGVAVDDSGAVYVTGVTESSDFPRTADAADNTRSGGKDAFAVKLSSDLVTLQYATYIGGSQDDIGAGIGVDASNNMYVCGDTESANFPTTSGALDVSYAGGSDGFVIKLNAGGQIGYSTYAGGGNEDSIKAIAVTKDGYVYVTGGTYSSDFFITFNAYDKTYNGGKQDAFVMKLNKYGSAAAYSTFLGTNDYDIAYCIDIDELGNAYVGGRTTSMHFPMTSKSAYKLYRGLGDGFVVQISPNGSSLVFSSYVGGNAEDYVYGVAYEPETRCVYAVGKTLSTNFPQVNDVSSTGFAESNGFAMLLSLDLSRALYSGYVGGAASDEVEAVAVDATGRASFVLNTNSIDIQPFPSERPLSGNSALLLYHKQDSINISVDDADQRYYTNKSGIRITGKCSIATGGIYYYNYATAVGGACGGVSSWNADIVLARGLNTVIFSAYSTPDAGHVIVQVYYDTEKPNVRIAVPTDAPTYMTTASAIPLGGSKSDDSGLVKVMYRTGSVGDYIIAGGDDYGSEWSSGSNLPLQIGENIITAMAVDGAGNTFTDVLTVTRKPLIGCGITSAKAITNQNPIVFDINFTEAVTGLTLDEISVTNGTGNRLGGSGSGYTLEVVPLADGKVECTVPGSAAFAESGAGNSSATGSVIYDGRRPKFTIRQADGILVEPPMEIVIEGPEFINQINKSKLQVTGGTIDTISTNNNSCSVFIIPEYEEATVTCAIPENTFIDAAGNGNEGASGSFVYDITPACVITSGSQYSKDAPISFTISFTTPVTGLEIDDISVSGGTKQSLVGSEDEYTLLVQPTAEGNVRCSVPAEAARDADGDYNIESDNVCTVYYDPTRPVCVLEYRGESVRQKDVTVAATFSEQTSGPVIAHFDCVNCRVNRVSNNGLLAYDLSITVLEEGQASVALRESTVADLAGNANAASGILSFNYDKAPQAALTPLYKFTNLSAFPFDIVFNETVVGFAANDIVVSNGVCESLTGDGKSFRAWVRSDNVNEAIVSIRVPADAAQDVYGGNVASSSASTKYYKAEPGAAWDGLCMVSVPVIQSVTDPKPVVGFDDDYWVSYLADERRYAMYSDDPLHLTWFDPPSSAPGRGFWSKFVDGGAAPQGELVPQDTVYEIKLNPGWNLIGSPFVRPVNWRIASIYVSQPGLEWRTVKNAPDLVRDFLWGWDGVAREYYLIYDSTLVSGVEDKLEPWKGYWIRALKECSLRLPPP